MTIKEVEAALGINRSQVRFYEKEELIVPNRNLKNGYKEYQEEDILLLEKILFLRKLGLSIENIRSVKNNRIELSTAIMQQRNKMKEESAEREKDLILCDRILKENIDFDHMDIKIIEQYENSSVVKPIPKIELKQIVTYYHKNILYAGIIIIQMLLAYGSYFLLPSEIAIQWSNGSATGYEEKYMIFLYPLLSIIILLLKPFIWSKCYRIFAGIYLTDIITEYVILLLMIIFSTGQIYSMFLNKVKFIPIEYIFGIEIILSMFIYLICNNQNKRRSEKNRKT